MAATGDAGAAAIHAALSDLGGRPTQQKLDEVARKFLVREDSQAVEADGAWSVSKAIMSRSARVLMEGWVRVPGDGF